MSDQTVYAEALIATVARAFYDDDAVCLIDVLLRDKFLRDDDMGPRLSLPPRQLRRTLQFLQEEHLVKYEHVDDLSSGGSQNTKFWYIDYNHAVNVIRLRVYLLKKKLEEAELRARSSSMYLCPGYKTKACNGRYTETEAQQVVDHECGLFLCPECVTTHESNPDPPPKSTYTLQLLDNTRDLRLAMDNMRRVNVQLSAKMIGNHQLRAGIYDLLQKVRSKGKGPLTSNLPSENRSLGIGSKRLAGTGRTAGIKAKKLAQQGVATTATGIRRYLGGATRTEEGSDLTFLKNAMGQEIAFEVEKGGGARANLLATKTRQRGKLMDAAASRVGVAVDIATALLEAQRRERKRARGEGGDDDDGGAKKQNTSAANLPGTLFFLRNNIGRKGFVDEEERERRRLLEEEVETDDEEEVEGGTVVVMDDADELRAMPEEERRIVFQSHYKEEKRRQLSLLKCDLDKFGKVTNGATLRVVTDGDNSDADELEWEEG
uniref:HTH TFE/IIEalpha-type domain-containing protein n=1 Tax=Ditylum brightwellii TaxID=49249 RepID=A0A7S1Z7X5_9STRA|mmetsp:Transcript_26461/g.39292  ORF Transcript_26461/g.39292 Transcript_26461/m.39292 type:complete len:489 (+) Transcript_26461:81-1547(+)